MQKLTQAQLIRIKTYATELLNESSRALAALTFVEAGYAPEDNFTSVHADEQVKKLVGELGSICDE